MQSVVAQARRPRRAVTTPVNEGTDPDAEGRNDEDHGAENRDDRHTTTGVEPSRPLTPSAEGTDPDVEGWNDEDQDAENGDDRQTTAGVKPNRSLTPLSPMDLGVYGFWIFGEVTEKIGHFVWWHKMPHFVKYMGLHRR